MLLIARFEDVVRQQPDKLFLHFIDVDSNLSTQLSFGDADRAASQRAHALLGYGLARGDRIGMLQPNSVDWVLWYLGALKAGLVTVALNTDAVDDELAVLAADAGVQLLIADTERAERAAGLQQRCPGMRAALSPAGDADTISIAQLLAGAAEHFEHDATVADDASVAIIYSSGTTGARPKAVQISNRQLVVGIGAYAEETGIDSDDRLLVVTPIFHSCTLSWGISMAILRACTIVLTSRFSASRLWDHAQIGQASFLWTMGSIIHILLQYPVTPAEQSALGHIRKIFAAGIGGRVKASLERWPNATIFDAYGLTESPGTLAVTDSFEHSEPYSCIGRPVGSIDMRIIDPQTGRICAPREQGEIVIDLVNGFRGYLNNPEAMAEAVRDGWFHTGDLAYADETGRLFFVDRIKDIIRSGGRNISAGEVEQVVLSHPLVTEVAAIPQPDAIMGEKVAVFCVLSDPAAAFGIADLRSHCAGKLAAYRIPEFVYVMGIDEIPRTPTGKIAKYRLKQMLRERAGGSAQTS